MNEAEDKKASPFHGIRCETEDFETVAEYLKNNRKSWAFLINVLATGIKNRAIVIEDVLQKINEVK